MGASQNLKVIKAVDHESVFLDHYSWLLERALRLTRGSKEEAEDLVQDLYVRLILSVAEIDDSDPDRLEGYLFKALQNLFSDKHRSRGRDPLASLQTADYDSMEIALAVADRSQLLHIRSDLFGICEYACMRRKSSRAGSVLILRFFLAYLPSEIAALLKASPVAIHKLVETGRLEAKAFLSRPGSLHFPGMESKPKISFKQLSLPDDPTALFDQLRCRILLAPEGDCLPEGELSTIYADVSKRQLTTREVAHLTSCRTCLERATHLLDFDDLSKRLPDSLDGPTDPTTPPSVRGAPRQPIERMRKKLRDTREHRPKVLEVCVDGQVRAAQSITSALSQFQILLKPSARPKYISLLSEQGFSLLYLDLESQEHFGLIPRRKEISLSDDRTLVLELDSSGSSTVIEVTYFDPVLEADDESWILEGDRHSIITAEAEALPEPSGRSGRILGLWRKFSDWFCHGENLFPISLAAAVGLATLFTIFALWLYSPRNTPQGLPSGSVLLAQSERMARIAIPPGGAAHQTFSLEVRDGDGKIIDAATVETLRSTSPDRQAKRMFDRKRRLVAGRWSDSRGRVTTYSERAGLRHPKTETPEKPVPEELWTDTPDAAEFDRIAGQQGNLQVERSKTGYDLTYQETTRVAAPTIVSADLTLSGTDLHPTAETLLFRNGKTMREYAFRELTYEIVPANQVTENDFEPDPRLVDPNRSGALSEPHDRSAAHLALAALQILSNLGPDVEQIVDLQRGRDGTIELSGVFPTSAERASVAQVFASLHGGSLLKIDLHASDDPVPGSARAIPVQVDSTEPVDIDTERIPFDSVIRAALSSRGLSGAPLEDRIRQVSNEIVSDSAQLHRNAWNISQIAAHDFTLGELREMTPEDQMLWATLLQKHIRGFNAQLETLRSALAPLCKDNLADLSDSDRTPSPVRDSAELQEIAVVLNHDSERLDRLLTAGFTLSPSGLPTNVNFSDVPELISDLDTEEMTLQGTIERLHALGQAETNQ